MVDVVVYYSCIVPCQMYAQRVMYPVRIPAWTSRRQRVTSASTDGSRQNRDSVEVLSGGLGNAYAADDVRCEYLFGTWY